MAQTERVRYLGGDSSGAVLFSHAHTQWFREQQHKKDKSGIETISALAGRLILVTNPGAVKPYENSAGDGVRHYDIYGNITRLIRSAVKTDSSKIGLSVHYDINKEKDRLSDIEKAIKEGREPNLYGLAHDAGDIIAGRLTRANLSVIDHNSLDRHYPHVERALDLKGVQEAMAFTAIIAASQTDNHNPSPDTVHIAVVDPQASEHLIIPAIGHYLSPGVVLEVTGMNEATGHLTMEQLRL